MPSDRRLEDLPGFTECLLVARAEGFSEEEALVLAAWSALAADAMFSGQLDVSGHETRPL